jgi:hypothetical protein
MNERPSFESESDFDGKEITIVNDIYSYSYTTMLEPGLTQPTCLFAVITQHPCWIQLKSLPSPSTFWKRTVQCHSSHLMKGSDRLLGKRVLNGRHPPRTMFVIVNRLVMAFSSQYNSIAPPTSTTPNASQQANFQEQHFGAGFSQVLLLCSTFPPIDLEHLTAPPIDQIPQSCWMR